MNCCEYKDPSVSKRTVYGMLLLSTILFLHPDSTLAAGIDSGEQPYERCALCHGLSGHTPRQKFPVLSGQRPDYMMAQLQAFIDGTRSNDGGQMRGVVTELDTASLQKAVAWFAEQTPPVNESVEAGTTETGEQLFLQSNCAQCHSNNGSMEGFIPYLSAQHPDYLTKQMRDFSSGDRVWLEAEGVHRVLAEFEANQLTALAAYLAASPRGR